jgi:hypothetical protein
MTDREILERAAAILDCNGYDGAASWINHALREWEPDLLQPEGREARTAQAFRSDGSLWVCEIDDDVTEEEATDTVRGFAWPVSHFGIVTAILPPTTVPVVKGKVSP